MVGRKRPALKSAGRKHGTKAGLPCLPQHFKAFPDENPVLIHKVHHIRHRCNRGIGNEIIQLSLISPQVPVQQAHQFIRDKCPADAGERVAVAPLLRIHHRIGRREASFRLLMMVRDQYRHTQTFGIGHRIMRSNAVIAGQDHVRAKILRIIHDALIQAIAFVYPVRRVDPHTTSQPLQRFF